MRIGMLFGLCLSISGVLIGGLSLMRIFDDVREYRNRSAAVDVIRTYGEALVVIELLALERGPISGNLGDSPSPDAVDMVRKRNRSVDEALEAMHRGVTNRGIEHSDALLTAIDRLQTANRAVCEDTLPLIATSPAARPAGSIERVMRSLFMVAHDGQLLLSRLDDMMVDIDAQAARALRIVRLTADMRETAGQLTVSTTAAHVAGRRFTDDESFQIERLRGRFDMARRKLESMMETQEDRGSYAVAWRTAQDGFFKQGLAWVDEIVAAGRSDGRYPITKEAQVQRIQPSLQTMMALRDASLDHALEAANRARLAALANLLLETGVVLALGVLLTGVAALLRFRIVAPLLELADIIGRLVNGDRTRAIPYLERVDEVGDIARTLRVVRDQIIAAERTTEQVRAAERTSFDEALRAREEASAASRNKSLFLAGMSHELRTPLNAIVGFAELMHKEMFGPLGDRYRGYAEDILNSGIHLLSLVNRILDLSKVEAGAFQPLEAPVDVREAVMSCVMLVDLNARTHGIDLTTRVGGTLPLVRGDETALRQIVTNILANAVKFTDAGGRVNVSIEQNAQNDIIITVADTGVGMNAEEMKLALVPFARVDTPLTRHREGTGLGLPLAKLLAESIGASLSIVSSPGVGTTVTITFPANRIIMAAEPRVEA